MRIVLQRVAKAEVEVDGEIVGAIDRGHLLLVGIHGDDTEDELKWMAKKVAQLRVFPDDEGRMNRSLLDVGGEALVVSQFTLYGNIRKGTRPSFVAAAHPDKAEPMYERFRVILSEILGKPVPGGKFGAHMDVRLTNDGPVTILLEK